MGMMNDVTRAGTRPGLWPNAGMVGVRARAHECYVIEIGSLCMRFESS